MIEILIDKIFAFDYKNNYRKAMLVGGWVFVFACGFVLFDSEGQFYWTAGFVALCGLAFAAAGLCFYLIAKKKKNK